MHLTDILYKISPTFYVHTRASTYLISRYWLEVWRLNVELFYLLSQLGALRSLWTIHIIRRHLWSAWFLTFSDPPKTSTNLAIFKTNKPSPLADVINGWSHDPQGVCKPCCTQFSCLQKITFLAFHVFCQKHISHNSSFLLTYTIPRNFCNRQQKCNMLCTYAPFWEQKFRLKYSNAIIQGRRNTSPVHCQSYLIRVSELILVHQFCLT